VLQRELGQHHGGSTEPALGLDIVGLAAIQRINAPIEHSADGIDELYRVSWSEPGFANFSVAAIKQSVHNNLTATKARVQSG
jgi:hypothetical protein